MVSPFFIKHYKSGCYRKILIMYKAISVANIST